MKNKMSNVLKRKDVQFLIILIVILALPSIAHASYPAPAPDRLPGESFWGWLGRVLWF